MQQGLAVGFSNVNAWTAKVDDFIALESHDDTATLHVFGIAEHRLPANAFTATKRRTLARKGWSYLHTPSAPGPHGGPSAGMTILFRKHLRARSIPDTLTDGLTDPDVASRVIGCQIRLRCTWLTIVFAYLWVTEALSARNLRLLQVITHLSQAVSGPFLLFGDFNMDIPTLAQADFPSSTRLTSLFPPNLPTCYQSKEGTCIDHAFASPSLLPLLTGPPVNFP